MQEYIVVWQSEDTSYEYLLGGCERHETQWDLIKYKTWTVLNSDGVYEHTETHHVSDGIIDINHLLVLDKIC